MPLDLIYFIYGFPFFVMGIMVWVRVHPLLEVGLARRYLAISLFGFLHSGSEWSMMFVYRGYEPLVFATLSVLMGALSYTALFFFPLIDTGSRRRGHRILHLIPLVLFALWAAFFVTDLLSGRGISSESLSRSILGFPAVMSAALRVYSDGGKGVALTLPRKVALPAAILLFLYGVLTIVSPDGVYVPPHVLTNHSFFRWTGMPVQLVRGAFAAGIAFFFVQALDVFDRIEKREMERKIEGMAHSILEDERERELLKSEVHRRENMYLSIINTTSEGFLLASPDFRILHVNQALCKMIGYSPQELIGRTPFEFMGRESVKVLHREVNRVERTNHRSYELILYNKSGDPVYTRINSTTMRGMDGAVESFYAFLTDITASRRVQDELRLHASVFRNAGEGVIITDRHRRIIGANRAFLDISGYSEEEILGAGPSLLSSGRYDRPFYNELEETLVRTGQWVGEIWNRKKDGSLHPVLLHISVVRDSDGGISNYVGLYTDISRLKDAEERLHYLAHHDPLTGLPNRTLFQDRLEHAIGQSKRKGRELALVFLDLDHFKYINDSEGHDVGDAVLQEVASRFRSCIREGDTIARLGGDEFALLLEEVGDEKDVRDVVERLSGSLSRPIRIRERDYYVTCSLGISRFPEDGTEASRLLKSSDTAMYRAKESGRNGFAYFACSMDDDSQRRLALENNLRRTRPDDEFAVYYQPQVSLSDGKIVAFEALLRWHNEGREWISPDRFIPIAESIGLMEGIGEWAMRHACIGQKGLLESSFRGTRICVNVSATQFRGENLVSMVRKILAETCLPPQFLEIEITESAAMQNLEASDAILREIVGMGVSVAIDDFGTGYSSLSYLWRFPLARLKIDRSFIQGIPGDSDARIITRTIINMAHSMNLEVVAEGVETPEQLEFLKESGCDVYQGFLFSEPLSMDDLVHKYSDEASGIIANLST